MAVVTYEGIVEGEQVRLPADLAIPEHARVYVIAPDAPSTAPPHLASPRLVRPEQIADFETEVREASRDAGV